MAKITDFDAVVAVASGDYFLIVDVSDTSEDASGSSKKLQTQYIHTGLTYAGTAGMTAGTATAIPVAPADIYLSDFGRKHLMFPHTDSDLAVATGDGTKGIPIPAEFNGWNIVDVYGFVYDKGVTGTTDIQIRRRRAGSNVDVLSTKVTIGDEWYAHDGVINTSNDDLATGDQLFADVDAVHSGTAPNGLSIAVVIQKT